MLTSLVAHEVEQIPRGASLLTSSSAGRLQTRHKSLGVVPMLVSGAFTRARTPNKIALFATAMLLTHEGELGAGRDGQVRTRHLIARSEQVRGTLGGLLQHSQLVSADWNRDALVHSAWPLFVQRCFEAVCEGRSAEVRQMEEVDETERRLLLDSAWLWSVLRLEYICSAIFAMFTYALLFFRTRDKLADQIKSASKSVLHTSTILIALSRMFSAGLNFSGAV